MSGFPPPAPLAAPGSARAAARRALQLDDSTLVAGAWEPRAAAPVAAAAAAAAPGVSAVSVASAAAAAAAARARGEEDVFEFE